MRLRWKLAAGIPLALFGWSAGFWLAGGHGWSHGTVVSVRLRNGGTFLGTVVVDSPLGIVLETEVFGKLWWLRWEIAELVLAKEQSWAA